MPVFLFSFAHAGNKNTSTVKVSIRNLVNGKKLVLNNEVYANAHGDSFTVRMYKYYISNIKLIGETGAVFAEPESYHLVNESKSRTKEFTIENVPSGSYTAVSFMIGVDSLHNVSGAQGGDLDPINAMFWDWNTGYIMAKMEGTLVNDNGKEVAFHIGGFAAERSVLRVITIPFGETKLKVETGKEPLIHLNSDLAEWFQTPTLIDFAQYPAITMEGKEAVMMADNYADMFTLQNIEE